MTSVASASDPLLATPRRRRFFGRKAVLGASGLAAAVLVVTSTKTLGTTLGLSGLVESARQADASAGLEWYVVNQYTQVMGRPVGLQYSWVNESTQVIDPLKDVSIYVRPSNQGQSTVVPSVDYVWSYSCDNGDAMAETVSPSPLEGFVFTSPADCSLTVAERGAAQVTRGLIKVRYVRREVRDLTSLDRDAFLDALVKLWELDGEKGRALYGHAFISSDELLSLHATNSALRDNDHFHNGAGFLVQHVRLDNMVLDALQAIDPTVVTPYWDWTIESRMYELGEISSPFDTPLWTKDWFGSLNYAESPIVVGPHYGISLKDFVYNSDGFRKWAIRDGRWSYTKVKRLPHGMTGRDFDVPVNSYGFVRSPWNNNPSPYVTRINFAYKPHISKQAGTKLKSWPSCSDLQEALTLQDKSLVNFMMHLEDMPIHADVHQALGGTVIDEIAAQKMMDVLSRHHEGEFCYQTVAERHIWRAFLADMQTGNNCGDGDTINNILNCQIDCSALDESAMVQLGSFVSEMYRCPTVPAPALTHDDLIEYAEAYCDLTFIKGEHLEASGTTDPSFFLVHPTLARYYQFKKLMGEDALINDWADVDHKTAACEPAIGACYAGKGIIEEAELCCAGHFRYSTYYTGTNLAQAPAATNEAILATIDPANDAKSAMIFHHLNWDHCAEDLWELAAPENDVRRKNFWTAFYETILLPEATS